MAEEHKAALTFFRKTIPRFSGAMAQHSRPLLVSLHGAVEKKEIKTRELQKIGEHFIKLDADGKRAVLRVAHDIHKKEGWKKAVEFLHGELIPHAPVEKEHEPIDEDAIVEEAEIATHSGTPTTHTVSEKTRSIKEAKTALRETLKLHRRTIHRLVVPVFDHADNLKIATSGVTHTLVALLKGTVQTKRELEIATQLMRKKLSEIKTPIVKTQGEAQVFHAVAIALLNRKRIEKRPLTLDEFQHILHSEFKGITK